MSMERRVFLRRLTSAGGGAMFAPSLAGLIRWNDGGWMTGPGAGDGGADRSRRTASPFIEPYGRLVASPDCPEIEIPESFRCVRLGSGGVASAVRDGLTVPNAFDGMAAFPLPNGNIRLIRNHEMVDKADTGRAIGSPHYDARASGGTTSLEVRITEEDGDLGIEVVDEFVSLAGTVVNCAGGPTPWGSWLSCEEITWGPEAGFEKPHGYIFEVPASATGPVDPVPLRAMGRFIHEAVAIDPATGMVYETEDTWYVPDRLPGAGFYRFLPNEREVLSAGGRLQMLAVTGEPGYLTARGQTPGTTLPVHWVDIEDPDPANAEADRLAVFKQGIAQGAARCSSRGLRRARPGLRVSRAHSTATAASTSSRPTEETPRRVRSSTTGPDPTTGESSRWSSNRRRRMCWTAPTTSW